MKKSSALRSGIVVFLILVISIIITFVIYRNGLYSPFVLDDMGRLQPMGAYPSFSLLDQIILFISHGGTTLTDRPVSYLSFYIQGATWLSSDPYSYKYTNLMIHILNGVLLFWFSHKLLLLARPQLQEKKNLYIAGLCMLLWLIHPLQITTVLYVIQRMSQLSTLFMLAALISYVYGRNLLNTRPARGYAVIILGVSFFGILGVLSKENAVLLPFFILIIEFTLLANSNKTIPKSYSRFLLLFLVLPILILMAAAVVKSDFLLSAYTFRNFSLYERLLTESRILMDYLRLIIVPDISGTGLFHDDYTVSHSIFNPISTIFSVLAIAGLLFFSLLTRKKHPIAAFAILWFFAGHLLESSFIGLELYFEHRNYFPVMGIMFAAAYTLITYKGKVRTILNIFAAFILISLPVLTFLNTFAWLHFDKLSYVWAYNHPHSSRAVITAGSHSLRTGGDLKEVAELMERAYQANPKDMTAILGRLKLKCLTRKISSEDIATAIEALKTSYFSNNILKFTRELGSLYKADTCPPFSKQHHHDIIQALIMSRPDKDKEYISANWRTALHGLYLWQGTTAYEDGNLMLALQHLDIADEIQPNFDSMLKQAKWLIDAGQYENALAYINKADRRSEQKVLSFLPNPTKPKINRAREFLKKARRESRLENKQDTSTP